MNTMDISLPFFKSLDVYTVADNYTLRGYHEGYFVCCDLTKYSTSVSIHDKAGHVLLFVFDYNTFSAGQAHDAVAAAFTLLALCGNKPSRYIEKARKSAFSMIRSIAYLDLYGTKDNYFYER